jgi:hypothetical protein
LPDNARNTRELNWDTYLDKVQSAWMGKMIGVTFGQPWEFQYQTTPIGFDITDWPLSPTRMKDYRSPAANNPKQENWDAITREADNQKSHPAQLHHGFGEGANDSPREGGTANALSGPGRAGDARAS